MTIIRIYIRSIWLLAAIMSCSFAAAQSPASELVRQLLGNLDSSYTYIQSDLNRQTGFSNRYDSLFNLLMNTPGLPVVNVADEVSIDKKLIAIARYKGQHPELFNEVAQKFIYRTVNPGQIAPSSPRLEPAFQVEQYRLVWEFFLLKPPAANMAPRYNLRAAEAIAAINNPASLVTLEKVYANAAKTKEAPDYLVVNRQKNVLLTIGKMPSEAGALSLARLVSIPVRQPDSTLKISWQPRVFVAEMLRGKQQLANIGTWKNIINRVEKRAGINADIKKVLREINND